MASLPSDVTVREVGPRDGLQAEAPIPVEARVRLIEALLAAGVTHVEACSFVSPTAVPAMAGAADVLAALGRRPGVRVYALVPNARGAELAAETNFVDELTVTVSASETYNQKNVGRSVDESVDELARVRGVWNGPIDAVVSCAFGSPYEGDLEPDAVAALGDRLVAAGADALTYADTTGMATPRRVHDLLDETGPAVGLHLHETRGTGLVNAYAALERGVHRFDTAVGGLGGSPFAAGAAGNLASEELVAVLDDLGIRSGIDVDRLIDAAGVASALVGHAVPSRVATAGPRTRLA